MRKWFRDWRPPWWSPEQFVKTVSPTGQTRWTYVPAGSEWQPEFGTVVS